MPIAAMPATMSGAHQEPNTTSTSTPSGSRQPKAPGASTKAARAGSTPGTGSTPGATSIPKIGWTRDTLSAAAVGAGVLAAGGDHGVGGGAACGGGAGGDGGGDGGGAANGHGSGGSRGILVAA